MHTDRCSNNCRQTRHAEGSRKENKIHEFLYGDILYKEHEMFDRASYCDVYISRPTGCTNSYNVSLFIIKCSTCFGLFSPSSGATFWSCISQLV